MSLRILFLSQLLPLPLDAGPKLRAYYVLRYLAEAGHRVTLLSFARESDSPEVAAALREICENVETVPLKRSLARDLRDGLTSLVANRPFLIVRDHVDAMVRRVADLTREQSFDAVHADQLWMAPFVAGLGDGPLKVLDQHNAVFQVARRWADVRRDPVTRALARLEARKLRRFEQTVCNDFERVVWVSGEDCRAVRGNGNGTSSRPSDLVIPIATDPAEHRPIERTSRPFRVTFVGGMHWPPNADGISWFADEVWPRVIRELPDARLTVIGKRPPASLERLGGSCDVVGFAPSLEQYLAETSVFVVPLRSGAGMRVKILDAWCWGVPVVSTTLGAEGLRVRAGENLLLGDTDEALAGAVVEVARNPELADRLIRGGRRDDRRVLRLAQGLPTLGTGLPMNILFVVPYAPSRVRTRPYHLVRALRDLGHEITLATIGEGADQLAELETLAGKGRVVMDRVPRLRSLWNCLGAARRGRPLQSRFSWSPALAEKIGAVIRERRPDVVHVEHLRGSCFGVEIRRQIVRERLSIPVVWDSVDCISYLFDQACRLSSTRRARLVARLEAGRTRRYEARLLRQFSSTVVTSEQDREALLELACNPGPGSRKRNGGSARVTVVSNGVDLGYFHPGETERQPRTVVFTGKMSYHANVTAVREFARDVLPRVRRRFPDLHFVVVGQDPPSEVRRLATAPNDMTSSSEPCPGGITVTGRVEDIRPYLWQAAAAVAPIKYGAGVQNKVLEAMSCGTPVVAARRAVAALEARVGTDCLVADNPDEYAAALGSIFEHPARGADLGTSGRRYVERCHDWQNSARTLERVYDEARERIVSIRQFRSAS